MAGPLDEYARVLRANRNFRWLYGAQIVSLFGDWFNYIATAALLARLTGNGLAVGGLFVVRMLAPFVMGPIAGVFADRYNRKRIMIATDVGRAIVVAGFLAIERPDQVWLLYVLTGAQLALSGLFLPARSAILPELVEAEDVGAANALSSVTWSLLLAVGSAIGGLATGLLGVHTAFVIDIGTFLVSAALLLPVRYQATSALAHHRASFIETYRDGLVFLREHPDVLRLCLHKSGNALVGSGGFGVVLVYIAKDRFVWGRDGGIGLGLAFGAVGLGTGIGPIPARRIAADRRAVLRKSLTAAYLCLFAGMACAAPLLRFEWVLLGALLRGVGGGTLWVISSELLYQAVPREVQGRVFATELALFFLTAAIAAGLTGLALESPLGAEGALGIMALLALPPAVWWSRYSRSAHALAER